MQKYSLDQFLEMVKAERAVRMSPYELVYKSFEKSGFDKQDESFFSDNASFVVESLREACWANYLPEEELFTADMLKRLIDDEAISSSSPKEAIENFVDSYPTYIYQLCLSNTQSRRSRAGKEFEAIIELLLMGASIPMDSQGNIGKRIFVDKGLGKLVDVVSPGVVEYIIDKNYTCLISAKTTLRERWQEVPEEMNRTGAREMFLATLDESITGEVLSTLYEANIRIVTTRNNKDKNYAGERRVITFEQLIEICNINKRYWKADSYTETEKAAIEKNIISQLQKHKNHPFVISYYMNRKNWLEK